MGHCKKAVDASKDWLYLLFRIIVGFFIFSHGLGKIIPGFLGPGDIAGFAGMLGGQVWLAWIAALAEMIAGISILLGFWSRHGAKLGAIVMVVALILVHFSRSLNPIANGSETALLFLAAFMVVFIMGNGKYSLERAITKKEMW